MTKQTQQIMWTAVASVAGTGAVLLLFGQIIFGAGASSGKQVTQQQIVHAAKANRKGREAIRMRIRRLEIRSGQRDVQIRSINGKLDVLLSHFQLKPKQFTPGKHSAP